jgi:RNA-binding protein
MALTGSQKRRLRSIGHKLDVAVTVGKGGLSDGLAAALKDLFTRAELLKVRLPTVGPQGREDLAAALAQKVGAAVAGVVGRTALLYKPNVKLPPEERIALP